jgi:hypothetical protein
MARALYLVSSTPINSAVELPQNCIKCKALSYANDNTYPLRFGCASSFRGYARARDRRWRKAGFDEFVKMF